jgi:hypothetical protein
MDERVDFSQASRWPHLSSQELPMKGLAGNPRPGTRGILLRRGGSRLYATPTSPLTVRPFLLGKLNPFILYP